MNSPYVGLTGGLGNQLFQIAKALSLGVEPILLDFETSGSYSTKRSDFLDFEIPDSILVKEIKTSILSRFLFSRCISSSIKTSQSSKLYGSVYRQLFQVVFQTLNKTQVTVPKYSGVGFYPSIALNNSYLIGYFQSWRWLENGRVLSILGSLRPARENKDLDHHLEEIKSARAIALHVRLGDYVNEKKFGTLTSDYYLKSLQQIDSSWRSRNLWVFSDDIPQAKILLSHIVGCARSVTFVGDIGDSPVYSWHLMRHARDFIIGNSTFSWWAAALRINSEGFVCAPEPWFVELDPPRDLIPKEWIRVQSDFA